jgi:hypothetical protein
MSHKAPPPVTRRDALCRIGNGFGMLAFAGMVGESLATAETLVQDPKVLATGVCTIPRRPSMSSSCS